MMSVALSIIHRQKKEGKARLHSPLPDDVLSAALSIYRQKKEGKAPLHSSLPDD